MEVSAKINILLEKSINEWKEGFELKINRIKCVGLFKQYEGAFEPFTQEMPEIKRELQYFSHVFKNKGAIKPSITTSKTGRIIMSEPNLQAIPMNSVFWQAAKDEYGAIYEVDYKQADFFTLAALSRDEKLISSIQIGEFDIYQRVAEAYSVTREEAKAITYKALYNYTPSHFDFLSQDYPVFTSFLHTISTQTKIITPLGNIIATEGKPPISYLGQAAAAEMLKLSIVFANNYNSDIALLIPRHDSLLVNNTSFVAKAMLEAGRIVLGATPLTSTKPI